MQFNNAVLHAYRTYPQSTIQDIVKLTCQLTLGPGHLIRDPASAVRFVLEESESVAHSPDKTLEPIGEGYFRAHLNARDGISSRAIAALFLYTAATAKPLEEAKKTLAERSQILLAMCREGLLPKAWEGWLLAWISAGMPLQHHSEAFRKAYFPAYRVVSESSTSILPFLKALDSALETATPEKPVLVAIDGNCASGKSCLGTALAAAYGANLIHMDDFFLRPEQRTPARFAAPGGNVDYERFRTEVTEPLVSGKAFSYQVFDCRTMSLGDYIKVEPKALTVVEGSYSQHPYFGNPYTFRVFLRCSAEEQMRRILRRNGEIMAKRFRNEWIPREEAYFSAFSLEESADFLIRN